jgi:phosphoribosylformylglycinamidine synthase
VRCARIPRCSGIGDPRAARRFSYGDDLGSGTVIANELTQHPAEPLARFVERGGLALGICNGSDSGEDGLLPGLVRAERLGRTSRCDADVQRMPELPGSVDAFEDRAVVALLRPRREIVEQARRSRSSRATLMLRCIEENKQVAFRYTKADGAHRNFQKIPTAHRTTSPASPTTGRVLTMPHWSATSAVAAPALTRMV